LHDAYGELSATDMRSADQVACSASNTSGQAVGRLTLTKARGADQDLFGPNDIWRSVRTSHIFSSPSSALAPVRALLSAGKFGQKRPDSPASDGDGPIKLSDGIQEQKTSIPEIAANKWLASRMTDSQIPGAFQFQAGRPGRPPGGDRRTTHEADADAAQQHGERAGDNQEATSGSSSVLGELWVDTHSLRDWIDSYLSEGLYRVLHTSGPGHGEFPST